MDIQKRLILIFILSLMFFNLGFLINCSKSECGSTVVDNCLKNDKKASIEGTTIDEKDWRTDCSLMIKSAYIGKTIVLESYGILIEYHGKDIIHAKIIQPMCAITIPQNCSLFAGYSSPDEAKAAYCRANPGAVKPVNCSGEQKYHY